MNVVWQCAVAGQRTWNKIFQVGDFYGNNGMPVKRLSSARVWDINNDRYRLAGFVNVPVKITLADAVTPTRKPPPKKPPFGTTK